MARSGGGPGRRVASIDSPMSCRSTGCSSKNSEAWKGYATSDSWNPRWLNRAPRFAGGFLHDDRFAMAAAYLFHIARNHPFLDGNKRTAIVSALTFLDLNGFEIEDSLRLYELTMAIAAGGSSKNFAAELFRATAMPRRSGE